MQWETVIGIEIHVRLNTQSKLFSSASTDVGAIPNSNACAVDLGLPGVLPVFNQAALNLAIRFGLSIDAQIAAISSFARKNYFYPDIPKGYQISQLDQPIVGKGHIDIQLDDTCKRIGITRAHLEEDAGKSVHDYFENASGIDLNRAGTALLEIVSEPDLRSAKEAVAYIKTLHQLVRYIDISDAQLQEGGFRCDINLSVRPQGQDTLGIRTELKNLNSFRFIERAILFEQQRQIDVLSRGGTVVQETRLYDPERDETRPMRQKEEAQDYRYFPDPDLLPIHVDAATIEEIRQALPELPNKKAQRFVQAYQLSEIQAKTLVQERATSEYFEAVLKQGDSLHPSKVAHWITIDLTALLNSQQCAINDCPITPKKLSELLNAVAAQTISQAAAKKVMEHLWAHPTVSVATSIETLGLAQLSDHDQLNEIIDQIIHAHPDMVTSFRAGKTKLLAFFVGQVMKATKGKANPSTVNAILSQKLNK